MRKLLCVLLLMPALSLAASVDSLKSLLNQTTTARARFAQAVLDKNNKPLQQVTGTMEFSRPGRFRWEYNKPYEQTIVGDGSRLWIYDKDLNQVTVRKLDRALGASPAALLAGSNEIDKSYTLKSVGAEGGLDWLEATPRTQDTAFERIRLGFGQNGLEAMELKDQFGQMTVIKFADLERNVKISPDAFKFTPPKGAAVISE
ncbi:MAG: Outer-rane lipoprotein carrier protein [Betaproteobacteria bacterium]|jgi:outer membrane lipoprotein carrier protein|nr:Outer-rane lipoprotein carrier protein [Betaproteobacteria bacterium]